MALAETENEKLKETAAEKKLEQALQIVANLQHANKSLHLNLETSQKELVEALSNNKTITASVESSAARIKSLESENISLLAVKEKQAKYIKESEEKTEELENEIKSEKKRVARCREQANMYLRAFSGTRRTGRNIRSDDRGRREELLNAQVKAAELERERKDADASKRSVRGANDQISVLQNLNALLREQLREAEARYDGLVKRM